MRVNLKSIIIPSGEREIDAIVTWVVRWKSRHGEYSSDIKPEAEVFKSSEEAEAFKASLEAAFKLLRHTSNTRVTIDKQA